MFTDAAHTSPAAASLRELIESLTHDYHCFLEASDRVTIPHFAQACQNVARQRIFVSRSLQQLAEHYGISLKSSAQVNELTDQLVVLGSERGSSDAPLVKRFIQTQEEAVNALNHMMEAYSFPPEIEELLDGHRRQLRSQLSYLNQLSFTLALAA